MHTHHRRPQQPPVDEMPVTDDSASGGVRFGDLPRDQAALLLASARVRKKSTSEPSEPGSSTGSSQGVAIPAGGAGHGSAPTAASSLGSVGHLLERAGAGDASGLVPPTPPVLSPSPPAADVAPTTQVPSRDIPLPVAAQRHPRHEDAGGSPAANAQQHRVLNSAVAPRGTQPSQHQTVAGDVDVIRRIVSNTNLADLAAASSNELESRAASSSNHHGEQKMDVSSVNRRSPRPLPSHESRRRRGGRRRGSEKAVDDGDDELLDLSLESDHRRPGSDSDDDEPEDFADILVRIILSIRPACPQAAA